MRFTSSTELKGKAVTKTPLAFAMVNYVLVKDLIEVRCPGKFRVENMAADISALAEISAVSGPSCMPCSIQFCACGVRQLAAAFLPASLLAGISTGSAIPRQQAGSQRQQAAALQSLTPNARATSAHYASSLLR